MKGCVCIDIGRSVDQRRRPLPQTYTTLEISVNSSTHSHVDSCHFLITISQSHSRTIIVKVPLKCFSSSHNKMSGAIMRLPPETIDDICNFVDSHADLLSLAATCHTWKFVIIPRHSEYRKVKVTRIIKHPFVWAHLRRRLDLARNVRSMQLVELRTPLSSPDRYPTTLFQKGIDDSVRFANHKYAVRNLCAVLAAMSRLQEFIWDNRLPPKYLIEIAVFRALRSSGCALKYLRLSGWFAMTSDAASLVRALFNSSYSSCMKI